MLPIAAYIETSLCALIRLLEICSYGESSHVSIIGKTDNFNKNSMLHYSTSREGNCHANFLSKFWRANRCKKCKFPADSALRSIVSVVFRPDNCSLFIGKTILNWMLTTGFLGFSWHFKNKRKWILSNWCTLPIY